MTDTEFLQEVASGTLAGLLTSGTVAFFARPRTATAPASPTSNIAQAGTGNIALVDQRSSSSHTYVDNRTIHRPDPPSKPSTLTTGELLLTYGVGLILGVAAFVYAWPVALSFIGSVALVSSGVVVFGVRTPSVALRQLRTAIAHAAICMTGLTATYALILDGGSRAPGLLSTEHLLRVAFPAYRSLHGRGSTLFGHISDVIHILGSVRVEALASQTLAFAFITLPVLWVASCAAAIAVRRRQDASRRVTGWLHRFADRVLDGKPAPMLFATLIANGTAVVLAAGLIHP